MMKKWIAFLLAAGVIATAFFALTASGDEAPQAQDRDVSWEEAIEILNGGEVVMVYQLHSLKVGLTLKDGSEISTTEPVIDAIFEEMEKCGSACEGIPMATE